VRQLKMRDTAMLVRGRDTYGHFDLEPEPRADLDAAALAAHKDAVERSAKVLYAAPTGRNSVLRRRVLVAALGLLPSAANAQEPQTPQGFLQAIYGPYLKRDYKGQPYWEAARFFAPDSRAPWIATCARPSRGASHRRSMVIPSSTRRSGKSPISSCAPRAAATPRRG